VSTFVLVHGAWHGAWCWERLTPELERRRHRVVAPDLPCEDPTATFDDYAGVVVDALAAVDDDDVVVVGHSLGGLTIPLVAARRPVRRLVFLCALIAAPGASLADQVRAEPDIFVPGFRAGLAPPDGQRRSLWVDYAIAREALYQDCAEEHAAAAFERLRPQSSAPDAEPCSLAALPAVPATSVVAAEDRIVNPAWSRRAARERLGVDPVELPGGHSPFLSRPGPLAEVLDAQAARSA
jgi:pimeloyl-ACP methyl ester carboxylesterase